VRRRTLLTAAMVATLLLGACGSGHAARSPASAAARGAAAHSSGAGAHSRGGAAHSRGGAAGGRVRLVRAGRFDEPTYVTGAPGDGARVFVLQRTGRVMLLRDGRKQSRPFLDIGAEVYAAGGAEQGLLGLAFAPDYPKTGLFYVDYTVAGNDIEVVRYRRSAGDPDVADPRSARTVLRIDHHAYTNHNGGQLAFGPEGDLFVGVGDGGSEGDPNANGQNTDTLLAKILRIAPGASGGYTIPAGNPFVGRPGRRPEIWAYGLRNPWRFSFDRTSGSMVIGDVGQDSEEELDFVRARAGAGANYGWSVWEGDRRFRPGRARGAVAPVLSASHDDGYCAIVAGYVVRDSALPSLYGRYLFGDFCRAQIESVRLSPGRSAGLRDTGLRVPALSSFGQDARGRIYVASLDGEVYRLAQR
jgi:glucose/arabinose dehydrogenase